MGRDTRIPGHPPPGQHAAAAALNCRRASFAALEEAKVTRRGVLGAEATPPPVPLLLPRRRAEEPTRQPPLPLLPPTPAGAAIMKSDWLRVESEATRLAAREDEAAGWSWDPDDDRSPPSPAAAQLQMGTTCPGPTSLNEVTGGTNLAAPLPRPPPPTALAVLLGSLRAAERIPRGVVVATPFLPPLLLQWPHDGAPS